MASSHVARFGDAAADDDERRVEEVHHRGDRLADEAAGVRDQLEAGRVPVGGAARHIRRGEGALLVEEALQEGTAALACGGLAVPSERAAAGERLEAVDVPAAAHDLAVGGDLDVADVACTALRPAMDLPADDDPGADARSRS